MQNSIEKILCELEDKVLKEKHIFKSKKYKAKFKMFVQEYIATFKNSGVLTPDEIKDCLKELYKTV